MRDIGNKINGMVRQANTLLTAGEWDEALRLYLGIIEAAPELRGALSWNINKISLMARRGLNPIRVSINDIFDEVYLINLEQDVDRLKAVAKRLQYHGIGFKVWRAIDGRAVIHGIKNDAGLKCGELGYLLSYKEVLVDAISKKYKRILVVDDDVMIHRQFSCCDMFSYLINQIDSDWRVLLLGASEYGWNMINEYEALVRGCYHPIYAKTKGSFALGLSGEVYEEIIAGIERLDSALDNRPLASIYQRYRSKCYVAYPNIMIADVTASHMRKKRDMCRHGQRMRWLSSFYC